MRNSKGFTLIELLVVIAIIGLLSTLSVVALNSARAKSRDSKRVSDIKQIQTALELYYADMNGYPVPDDAITLGGTGATVLSTTGFSDLASGSTYMGMVPDAPTPADGDNCTDAANNYVYDASTAAYSINFCLGATTGDLGDGPHTATANGIQ